MKKFQGFRVADSLQGYTYLRSTALTIKTYVANSDNGVLRLSVTPAHRQFRTLGYLLSLEIAHKNKELTHNKI